MIVTQRGNALLVGVGGCGKQSLTRLACHVCGYQCFQIELTRGYNYESFHEDLRKVYQIAGVQGKDTVFLFTDTQVMYVVEWKLNLYYSRGITTKGVTSCAAYILGLSPGPHIFELRRNVAAVVSH